MSFDVLTYPTAEPATLIAGDRWAWRRPDLPATYPTADYALSYAARREGVPEALIAITATETASDYVIEIASALTATYPPGRYRWAAMITRTSDAERVTIGSGEWLVLADSAADATSDPRGHVRRTLDALESVIEGLASKRAASYSIEGRVVTYRDLEDLRAMRARYRAELADEARKDRIRRGYAPGGRIRVIL